MKWEYRIDVAPRGRHWVAVLQWNTGTADHPDWWSVDHYEGSLRSITGRVEEGIKDAQRRNRARQIGSRT